MGEEIRRTDAWILLAAKYAARDGFVADLDQLSKAADFINHAKPLLSEIEHAVTVLGKRDLLGRIEGALVLGSKFREFWEESGAGDHRNIHRQLDIIHKALLNS